MEFGYLSFLQMVCRVTAEILWLGLLQQSERHIHGSKEIPRPHYAERRGGAPVPQTSCVSPQFVLFQLPVKLGLQICKIGLQTLLQSDLSSSRRAAILPNQKDLEETCLWLTLHGKLRCKGRRSWMRFSWYRLLTEWIPLLLNSQAIFGHHAPHPYFLSLLEIKWVDEDIGDVPTYPWRTGA